MQLLATFLAVQGMRELVSWQRHCLHTSPITHARPEGLLGYPCPPLASLAAFQTGWVFSGTSLGKAAAGAFPIMVCFAGNSCTNPNSSVEIMEMRKTPLRRSDSTVHCPLSLCSFSWAVQCQLRAGSWHRHFRAFPQDFPSSVCFVTGQRAD